MEEEYICAFPFMSKLLIDADDCVNNFQDVWILYFGSLLLLQKEGFSI